MATLEIVPIYMGERAELLARLRSHLERPGGWRAEVTRPRFDPELAFDTSRGQYSSTILLRCLLDTRNLAFDHILGVVGVDLFSPALTFVYGEAQLAGPAAVVSLHRLRPEAYGQPDNFELLCARLIKETVHELGHTRGLIHCTEPSCVMHASTYVEEIDIKSREFCMSCEGVRSPSTI